jgi:hypothetical protein
MLLLAGCPVRRVNPGADETATLPVAETQTAPEIDVAAIVDTLNERQGEAIRGLRMTARAMVDDEVNDERLQFRASLIAEPPDHLRFRASREPIGEVFSLLQSGAWLTIHLPRDQLTFTGPFDSMSPEAGILRQLQPRAMLRGLLAGELLARQGASLSWSLLDAGTLAADGPSGFEDLPVGRFVIDRDTLWLRRLYLYEATESGSPGELRLSVVISAWTDVAGHPLPERMVVSLPRERARIEIDAPDYLVNPSIPPGAFVMTPPAGTAVHPLSSLRLVEAGAEDAADDVADAVGAAE